MALLSLGLHEIINVLSYLLIISEQCNYPYCRIPYIVVFSSCQVINEFSVSCMCNCSKGKNYAISSICAVCGEAIHASAADSSCVWGGYACQCCRFVLCVWRQCMSVLPICPVCVEAMHVSDADLSCVWWSFVCKCWRIGVETEILSPKMIIFARYMQDRIHNRSIFTCDNNYLS